MNMNNNSAFICDGLRTPIGKYGGTLSKMRADDMAAYVIKSLVERNPKINTAEIDDVIFGCANQAGEDNRNVARMAVLLAELPFTVPGETVNRLCASGMSAVINAARAISAGDGDLYIAGGVENMSRAPFVLAKSESAFDRSPSLYDTTMGWRFINPKLKAAYGTDSMGETAENVAELYKITRESQDKLAYSSQMKAAEASQNGRLSKEIIPVVMAQKKGEPIVFSNDEFIRPDTDLDKLSKLNPCFRNLGTVTPGNSSGINDGAAAVITASESAVNKFSLIPMTRIVSSAVVGVKPEIMGIGPVEAANKTLKKAGLTFNDIDIIELNEAFAAQVAACLKQWKISEDDPRLNPNGGAIALGHPLGMSGTRLILSASYELKLRNLKYALCTMCIGVGQGYAVILENVGM